MSDPRFHVLIVGCGQLGSRHLQAVAQLADVASIDVVDPRSEALELGKQRLAELGHTAAPVRWLPSLTDAAADGGLCIVATQADGRCELVRQVVEQLGYRAFLLEKLVAQSMDDYESIKALCDARGVAAWVNCKTRAYPFHQYVKRRLDPSEPLVMHITGGNHGLANNGIHGADLFAFYDGCERIELAGARIDPVLHRTKRGHYDLSGTLHGFTMKGSHFALTYASDHAQSEQISITTRRYRCIVDQLERWAMESDASTGWTWWPVPFEGDLTVSAMTKTFARDILRTGSCELPTLAQCAVGHRFILDSLQPQFSQLLEQPVGRCPVT